MIALIATGRPSAMIAAPCDDDGWRKAITSMLLAGRQVACIDNVEGKLFAPSLALALTGASWQDRILGASQMVTLPHQIVWLATGNNLMVGGDLPRRCVRFESIPSRRDRGIAPGSNTPIWLNGSVSNAARFSAPSSLWPAPGSWQAGPRRRTYPCLAASRAGREPSPASWILPAYLGA